MFLETLLTAPPTRLSRGLGRGLTGLAVVFLTFDGVIKLMSIAPVQESFARLGFSPGIQVGIGLLELACVAIHLVPRSSMLGAILLTGFLGGATASHVRIGDPLATHVLFPGYVAVLIWGGLFLRDDRLRGVFPLRRGG